MELTEVENQDKAKFLIQHAKLLQQYKFIKEFDFSQEKEMLELAIELLKNTNSKDLLANAIDLIGTCIYSEGIFKGEFEEAIDYFNQALSIRNNIDDKLGICKSYFNMGLYYENKKDSEQVDILKSFEFYQKGLEISLEMNFKLEQSYFYRHLGYYYLFHDKDYEKALKYHKNTAKLREEIGFDFSLQFAYLAIAYILFLKNDFNEAKSYFIKAISAAVKVNRFQQLKTVIYQQGDDFADNKDVQTALNYYQLILESACNLDIDEVSKAFQVKINKIRQIM